MRKRRHITDASAAAAGGSGGHRRFSAAAGGSGGGSGSQQSDEPRRSRVVAQNFDFATGFLEGTGQIKAYNRGVDALMREFPRMSNIERCRLVR